MSQHTRDTTASHEAKTRHGDATNEADTPGDARHRRKQPFVLCRRVSGTHTVAIAAAAIGTILLSSVVAWDGTVPSWERDVLFFFNDWPDALEPLMWVLQQVGVLLGPVGGGLVIFAFTRKWQHMVPFFLVLPLKLSIEKGLVKQLVERERPFASVGDEVNVRGPAFEGLSFPSGHTTTAFALGILVSAFLPAKWRAVPIAWAFIVGIARMYYGEHNLLDVVAGAAMGTLFATTLWFLFLNRLVEDSTAVAPEEALQP